MQQFKAFVRVVKSIAFGEGQREFGFDSIEVLREPLIEAEDKAGVKKIILEKYPQFFQNGKVYEKETKDKAQFFYVVIFPLYEWEKEQIKEGEWNQKYLAGFRNIALHIRCPSFCNICLLKAGQLLMEWG